MSTPALDLSPHARGLVRWSMTTRACDLDVLGREQAAKLYFLAAALPKAPAGELLAVVQGDKRIVWSNDGQSTHFERVR